MRCLISRTGYTGEHGYEIYCANMDAAKMYETVMEAGKEEGLIPAGLGARDTLRLEAAMPLYGHELGDDIPVTKWALISVSRWVKRILSERRLWRLMNPNTKE